MSLIPDKFTHVYVLDTEYIARPGEQQKPVCLVAKGFKKARDIRMFFSKPQECPFVGVESDTTLFIGFNVPSEYKCFLALGWPLPHHTIDLYVEYRNLTNGLYRGKDSLWDLGTGLEDVVREMGGNPSEFWHGNKDAERKYVMRYGTMAPTGKTQVSFNEHGNFILIDEKGNEVGEPELPCTQEEHEARILRYCEEDARATHFAAQQILKETDFDFDQALNRGSFCRAVAWFEHNGLPVDQKRFERVKRETTKLQIHIAREIESKHNYSVYAIEGKETTKNKPHPVFKMNKFADLLAKHGITIGNNGEMWQATDSGQPILEDEYFEAMCNGYPWLQPLRQSENPSTASGDLTPSLAMTDSIATPFGCTALSPAGTTLKPRNFYFHVRIGCATY